MKISDINPHIRFAEQITYSVKSRCVSVNDCRIFYITNGNAQITVGGQIFTLTKNTLFYCCGGTTYTIETNEPLSLYSLNFDLTQSRSHIVTPIPLITNAEEKVFLSDKCRVDNSDFLNSFTVIQNAVSVKKSIASITEEYFTQKSYFREKCSSMLKLLLIEMHRTEAVASGSSTDTINKLITYITENFTSEIQNSQLAKIAGYHEYYLNRLFIRNTGISMHKYILNLRIAEGKRLLLETALPVAEIAARTGFNSNTHFSAYFKKELNMTPSEFRNNFKNNI